MRQAIWQIHLPALKHIPRPTSDAESPNAVHQADLLILLIRFKAAEPLKAKDLLRSQRLFRQSISVDH